MEAVKKEARPWDTQDPPSEMYAVTRLYEFTREDFGFTDVLGRYVASYHTDPESKKKLDDMLEAFVALMLEDVAEQPVYDSYTGMQVSDRSGKPLKELRSIWLQAPGSERRVSPLNPALPSDFWITFARERWLEIAPLLRWFDPEPDVNPEGKHTANVIARRLNPNTPRRRKALEFLAKFKSSSKAKPRSTGSRSASSLEGGE